MKKPIGIPLKRLLLYSFVLVIAGCNKGKTTVEVMLAHAAPGTVALDFFLQGNKQASQVEFGEHTIYFVSTVNAKDNFTAEVKDFSTDENIATVFNPPLLDAKKYSLFIFGIPGAIKKEFLLDDFAAPEKGHAKVRFIHLSPDAQALDVFANGITVVTNKEYFGDKVFNGATGFQDVGAGIYTVDLKFTSSGDVAGSFPNIDLADGKVYTLYAKGLLSGDGEESFDLGIIQNN